MHTFAYLLAAAAGGHFAARALGLPSTPLLLVAGFVLGTTGTAAGPLVQQVLLLGVTVLLFVSGVELDPRRPQRRLPAALRVGIGQFVTLSALGFGAALLLGWDPYSAVYLGLAVSASSTLVIVRILQRRHEMFEPFGRLTVGVLLVQDLLLIALVPVVDRMSAGAGAVALGLAGTGALVAAAVAASVWISPLLLRLERDGEALLLGALLQLAAFLAAAALLGLPLIVGAFLAGVSLARFPISAVVRPLLTSLGDFFSALFFTALGVLIGLPTAAELGQALVFVAILLIATPVLVTIIGEAAGLAARPAVEAGLLLAQGSELSLVIGILGLEAGILSESAFTILALVTGLTMLLTPLIATDRVTVWLLRWHPFHAPGDRQRELPKGGVLLLGAGSTGMPLLTTLRRAGHDVIVVDDDPAVLGRAAERGVAVVRGDASAPATLGLVADADVRVVVSTLRRASDNRRVLAALGEVPVLVRVFDEQEARWVQAEGGIPVLTSDAAAEAFLDWLASRPAKEPVAAPQPPSSPSPPSTT